MIATQIIKRVIDPAAVAAALGGPATRPPGLITQPVSRIVAPSTAAVPAVEPEPSPAPPAPAAQDKPRKAKPLPDDQ